MTDNDYRRADQIAELARLLPVPGDRDLPADRSQFLREHLINEFRMASPGNSGTRPDRAQPGSHRPRHRTVTAAVLGGVLAAATAIAVTLSPAGHHPASPPGAGPTQHAAVIRLLARIADAASQQPAPAPHGRPWEYLKIVEKAHFDVVRWNGGIESVPGKGKLATQYTELWRPVSDICRGFAERTTPPLSPGSSPAPSRPSYGGPGEKCPSTGDLNRPTYRLMQTLPTSPHRLLSLIYTEEKGHGPTPAQEAFTTIGDLLRNSIAPPQVTAALYRAAALIPGVTLVPDAVTATGQHGVAVALTEHGVREEWIFARNTLRNIGQNTVENGSVTDATAIVDRAFVNRVGQTFPARG